MKKLARTFHRGRMLLPAPLFGLVLALAFILPAFATTTVTKNIPYDAGVVDFCVTPSDTVQITGTFQGVTTFNFNSPGKFLADIHAEIRGTATSSTGTNFIYNKTLNLCAYRPGWRRVYYSGNCLPY